MKARNWILLGATAFGTALAVSSFLPQRFPLQEWQEEQSHPLDTTHLPAIDVTVLRSGSITIPRFLTARGVFSAAPSVIAHSAILIRHPKATFLYDTGLSGDIYSYLAGQSLFFRKTLGNFYFEQSLGDNLRMRGIQPNDLDFALISHLHWDHVSGAPDIPTVPLRIHRIEYTAAKEQLFDQHHGLVGQLLAGSPIELIDCEGPEYEGFRYSHDLFSDGSIILVPLPGHTAGQLGMFINRSNGPRIFLVADAAWVADNYLRPTTMHPFFWSRVTQDDATARQTLIELHHFQRRHPSVCMIAMHDGLTQEAFMHIEQTGMAQVL